MRINRSSDKAPDWMLNKGIAESEVSKISGIKSTMSDDDVVAAMSEIERCAETGETFHISENLDVSIKSELKEYAQVVGLDNENVKVVPSDIKESCETLSNIKKAESIMASERTSVKQPIFDLLPEVKVDSSNFEKRQSIDSVALAKNLVDKPSMESPVRAIRGGEKYENNPLKGVRQGEASIAAPDAIQQHIDDGIKSGRDVIRNANAEREHDMKFKKDNWESEIKASMSQSSILPQPGLHRVEAPKSQNHTPGASWNHSILGENGPSMPERTSGERIASMNSEKSKSIQRSKEDDMWESVKDVEKFSISDVFHESLKKQVGKIKK